MSKHERIVEFVAQFSGLGVDPHYAGYFALVNRQEFYAAHEVLEDLWLAERRGANGNFYKGLIQLAGAFVHLQKHRLRPAEALFKLAQVNLAPYPTQHERLDLGAVLNLIQRWRGELERGQYQVNPLTEANRPQLQLETPPPAPKRILLAGGSGFIGRALAKTFQARGYEVVILTRSPRAGLGGIREIEWNGEQLGEWMQSFNGAEAVINLAGKNINCPHTPENLREIIASRVNSVNAIAAAIHHATRPPRVWVQASAVGFYGDTGDRNNVETALSGHNSLAEVCRRWEAALEAVHLAHLRKVTLRIGFVLGRDGGALPILSRLTQCFLGGTAGSGRQYVSWIHLADLIRMFVAAVEYEPLVGTFNAVAPIAATNATFMRELRRARLRPWSPPVPEFAIRLGARLMRSEPSLALASQRCAPKRFLELGFEYEFPQLRGALKDLCAAG